MQSLRERKIVPFALGFIGWHVLKYIPIKIKFITTNVYDILTSQVIYLLLQKKINISGCHRIEWFSFFCFTKIWDFFWICYVVFRAFFKSWNGVLPNSKLYILMCRHFDSCQRAPQFKVKNCYHFHNNALLRKSSHLRSIRSYVSIHWIN